MVGVATGCAGCGQEPPPLIGAALLPSAGRFSPANERDEKCIKEIAGISLLVSPPFYNSEYPIQSYFVFRVYALNQNLMKSKKELVQSPFPLNK